MGVIASVDNQYVDLTVSFNDVNLRLTAVDWILNIPSGWGVRTQIWRTDIDPVTPVVDRSDYVNGSENVPGNFSVVEHTDEFYGFTYYSLPPELRFQHTLLEPQ